MAHAAFFSVHFLVLKKFTKVRKIQFASNNLKWGSIEEQYDLFEFFEIWKHIYVKPKIILAQMKGNLKLSVMFIKIHSHTVLIKKQQNFQIHLELERQR